MVVAMTNPMTNPVAPVVTETAVLSACLDVDRLEKELDITNADYIALWLASSGQMSISFLACRIADAYDRARDAELERLRAALSNIRALAAKRQHEGGPDGNLKTIEEFANYGLKGTDT